MTDVTTQILELLLQATEKGLMIWRIGDNDNVDEFFSEFDDEQFAVEFINLSRTDGLAERSAARIQSKTLYTTYSVGTKGYQIIKKMLCENIFGWKEASQIAEKKNHSLRDRLESALSESGGRELTD